MLIFSKLMLCHMFVDILTHERTNIRTHAGIQADRHTYKKHTCTQALYSDLVPDRTLNTHFWLYFNQSLLRRETGAKIF
jgi:hypothetical protein